MTSFVSSGEVPGYLLNQFSLSEWNGYLRVASTSRPIWWGVAQETPGPGYVPPATLSQSYVTVLASQGGLLVPVGQVSGLGQGEQIYSVRFVGDAGYVVTYRQVDPLYTIDLSTPTAPRVAGELELEGYSAYLQPVGAGLLLGIGQDVSTDTNEPTGAQIELFDVSDPSAPRLIAKDSLGTGSSSQVTYDHHAFLFWGPTGLVVFPVQVYASATPVYVPGAPPVTSSQPFNGAIGYTVTSSGITEVAPIVQDTVNGSTPTIERSLVIGDQLYTVSDLGVMASNLERARAPGVRRLPDRLARGRATAAAGEQVGRGRDARPARGRDPFRAHYRSADPRIGAADRRGRDRPAARERAPAAGPSQRAPAAEAPGPCRTAALAPPPGCGGGAVVRGPRRLLVRLAWVAAAALLLAAAAGFGIRSWATGAADLALIAVTALWFAVSTDEFVPPSAPRPQQLELFE